MYAAKKQIKKSDRKDQRKPASSGKVSENQSTVTAVNNELGSNYTAGPVFNLSQGQTKYTIGQVNDPFEQEADAVADNLIGGKTVPPISAVPKSGPPAATTMETTGMDAAATRQTATSTPQVQALCAECKEEMEDPHGATVQRVALVQTRPALIQRLCSDCEKGNQEAKAALVQRSASFPPLPDMSAGAEEQEERNEQEVSDGEATPGEETNMGEGGAEGETIAEPQVKPYVPMEKKPPPQAKLNSAGGSVPPASRPVSLSQGLATGKSSGRSLAAPVRRDMEQYFGRDLSRVRIHTDTAAISMNQSINARAFTHENDIYFNTGEYQPGVVRGRHLLAHELTHTLQQGAMGEVVQRYPRPSNDVELEPDVETPRDGEEVEGRMNQKLDDHPDVKEPDELDEDERAEAENPDRSEIRQESSEISSSGESSPTVDRGATAQTKTTTQQSLIDQHVQEQPEEASEEQEGEAAGESAEVSDADAAAQRAVAAEERAQSVQIPAEPQPFRHPRIETPVDSAGEDLPRNAPIDSQVRGLGYIGEALREKGYEMKRHAAEKEQASYVLDAVLERLREDLANAQEGTDLMEEHNESRKEIARQSHEVHAESVSRQQFVAEEAPELARRADEGQEDSGELASDTQSKADRSQREIPDDPDARADAERQSSETGESSEGAASMDQAVRMTGDRARQEQADAAEAAELNTCSAAQVSETEGINEQTGARIGEMHAANQSSSEQIENAGPGPELIRQHSQRTARTGDELIAATMVMEAELIALQAQYLNDMRGIEKREDAERRQQEEAARESPQPELSTEQRQVYELAGMNDEEQEQYISELNQPQRDSLMSTLEQMISEAGDQGTNATEGARFEVKTGMSEALGRGQAAVSEAIIGKGASQWLGLSQPDPDPRRPQIDEVEQRRGRRVGGVLDIGDQNLRLLDQHTLEVIANRVVAESIRDDIMNINVLQLPKQMIMGMINPVMGLQGVLDGFDKTLSGLANIGNWEAWQRDPLGNLLQIGADISTGLAMIFSSIIGIATIITAIMVAFIIVTWGFGAVTASPVIAWMGSLITFAGKGAIICGALSVLFNYLSYIKNLHDASTAQTAREFFGNTEQMKQNATDGFQGAMAIMEGVGAAKMGPGIRSGTHFANMPRSPGAWARQTMRGARESLQNLASMPGRIGRGARALYRGGRRGLQRFKARIEDLFARRRPGRVDIDVDAPSAGANRQRHLDDARNTRVNEMDGQQLRAEMGEVAQGNPRRVDRTSEFFDEYDVEIEANGHTYRRRRDGRGWCRFSNEECGIGDGLLPEDVRNRANNLEPEFRDPDLEDPEVRNLLDENERALRESGQLTDTPENIADARRAAQQHGASSSGRDIIHDTNLDDLRNMERICFVAGTLVKTASADKNIEDVEVGEKVYSYNVDKGKVELKSIVRLFSTKPLHVYEIDMGMEVIRTTGKHPFYVVDKNDWVSAQDLMPGMRFKDINGNCPEIKNIHITFEENITYNFEVEGNNNYFVGRNGILVHNMARKRRPNFGSQTVQRTDFYGIWDSVEGRYVYVGQAETGRGGYMERFSEHVGEGRRRGGWKSRLGDTIDGIPRYEPRLLGQGDFSPYGAAVTERYLVERNGGLDSLLNEHPIISDDSFNRYRDNFIGPCID